MMINGLNSALQGLQRNQRDFLDHAERISRWGLSGVESGDQGIDLAEEMIGVLAARRGYEANLPVVRTLDEMLGTLIDVLA